MTFSRATSFCAPFISFDCGPAKLCKIARLICQLCYLRNISIGKYKSKSRSLRVFSKVHNATWFSARSRVSWRPNRILQRNGAWVQLLQFLGFCHVLFVLDIYLGRKFLLLRLYQGFVGLSRKKMSYKNDWTFPLTHQREEGLSLGFRLRKGVWADSASDSMTAC